MTERQYITAMQQSRNKLVVLRGGRSSQVFRNKKKYSRKTKNNLGE